MITVQLQILNKILATKDLSMVTLNNLTKEYFSDYQNEFNFIMNHYSMYKQVPDSETFKQTFNDFDFIDVSEPNSYLLEQLYKEYNRNVMVKNFNDIRKHLVDDNVDAAMKASIDVIDKLQHGSAMTCTDIMSDFSRFDRFKERSTNLNQYYIHTGFNELDKAIGGIDKENENMVIAARTGIGKSWTLIKMAVAASEQGLNVGIYSGEMSVDKVGYRVDTLMANSMRLKLSNIGITRGYQDEEAAYKNYIEHLKLKTNLGPIKVLTPNDIAGPATVDALRAFIEKEHLDILFVDQYSLLEDTSHAKQGFERVANISKAIKNLQVMKQIPIISVSQMNRTKNEDGSQDTTQIGLSDRIGQDATVILMLDKEEDKANKGLSDEKNFIMTINVVKARDGGDNNKLKYNVNFNTGTFTFLGNNTDGVTTDEDCDAQMEKYNIEVSTRVDEIENGFQ